MRSKLWVFRDIDTLQRQALARALSISAGDRLLARGSRGDGSDEASAWMSNPTAARSFLIPDMEQAVERLHRAVTSTNRSVFTGTMTSTVCRRRVSICHFFRGWATGRGLYPASHSGRIRTERRCGQRMAEDGIRCL